MYSDTDSNNNACRSSNPTIASELGRGSVKCDLGSTVAEATCLIARASSTTPDGGVRFRGEFYIIAGTFTLGQVLNFGNLAYVADCYNKLCPLDRAVPRATSSRCHPLHRAS
jgi:hypothetical protein